ncbi:MAG: hypothetical protein ISEC1_P0218 [Thiomicrorhabdus sp.]|nr:MAG: hypothetical protein ISEC1_P0218 [Thiomicrorhabdus sp.]
MFNLRNHYKALSVIICLVVAAAFIAVGYMVAPVLFSELAQKQAGQIMAVLFNKLSLLALILLMVVIAVTVYFERQLNTIKSLVLSLGLLVSLKFWISPWMAEIKASYPEGLNYGAADWNLFASLHGVYQLLYLIIVLLLFYWCIKVMLRRVEPVVAGC